MPQAYVGTLLIVAERHGTAFELVQHSADRGPPKRNVAFIDVLRLNFLIVELVARV